MNKFEFKNLTPFKWFVLENFPFIEADFDALTEWQIFCKLGKEINKIIDSQNIVGEQAENLTNAFNNLKNYVDNYFDNLDVQDEINNKLNEMAESGELTEIIAQYLQLAGVLAYDNKSDLKNASNLVNGSIAKTLGKINYNDGQGNYYKIRTVKTTDIIDDDNIISLTNSETLVAEKIKNYYINQLENKIDHITDKKYVFIGDSYGAGYTPDGAVTGWNTILKNLMGLSNNECTILNKSGAGFNENLQNTYLSLIQSASHDNNVTDVLIAGGYNDVNIGSNYDNINSGMSNVKNALYNKYPNLKNIYIAFIGNTKSDYGKRFNCGLMSNIYNNACSDNNMIYIKNSEFILHDYYNQFSSDGIHPNQTGENAIARYLVNGLKTGSCDVKYNKTEVISGNTYLYTTMSNEITSLVLYDQIYLNLSVEGPISCSGNNAIKIAAVDGGQIYNSTANLRGLINAVFVDNSAGYNKYYDVPCYIKLIGDELLLYPFKTNSENLNFLSITPIAVQLRPFSLTFDSTYI